MKLKNATAAAAALITVTFISGFIALLKRRIVLWWLIPTLAALAIFALSLLA
jgi:hypothetical protein